MASAQESYEDFVGQILRPTNLDNLKYPVAYEKVSIMIHRSDQGPTDELEFEDIYPFNTVADLSTQIYTTMELKEEFHPQNQCLLLESGSKFIHLKYIFDKTTIEIESPFTQLVRGPNKIFVDIDGNPRKQDITSRDQMLLEDVLFSVVKPIYTVHLFLYTDIYAAYPGIRPVNRLDWEGIFRIYFPETDKAREDGSLSESLTNYAPIRAQRFQQRQASIAKLDQLLIESSPLRKLGETVSNIKNLRFTWNKPGFIRGYQPFRLESVFYDMPVSTNVPYIRYYPVSSTPLSKVHVEGPLNIPSLEEPAILLKWVQESPVLPEQEFMVAKILIRPGSGSVNPLYGSLFIFQDGSAMFAIQPNADTKSLSKQGDLYNLVPLLNSVMASIPGRQAALGQKLPPIPIYSPRTVKLTDGYIVLSLWLEKDDVAPITSKSLMSVLPFFRGFFQITSSPIHEQAPIAFLRYKGVNNFQTPSRDFQYLIRISDLQKIRGATSLPSLVSLYKEEFDVSDEVAHSRVSAFISEKEKHSVVNPETLEYTQKENPGIDIAIFGKHPYYTFHIYRVDSALTLKRIKTLLTLLVSTTPADFSESLTAAVLEEEEDEAEADAEADADAQVVDEALPSATPSIKGEMKALASLAAVEDVDDAEIFDDGLGAFGGFGDEEEPAAAAAAPVAAPAPVAVAAPAPVTAPVAAPIAPKAPLLKPTPAKAKAKDDDDDEITDVAQIKLQPARIYFRKRLQFYDRTLFSYSKTHPSLKKYPSMCAANALKQPTVMSEDEYRRMKDIYAKDIEEGRLQFMEYPVKAKGKGVKVKPVKGEKSAKSKLEVITTLRYGSNLLPGQANIYICSEYWCIKDELVILKGDFEGTTDRKGRSKEKNTCPFCRGGLITDRERVMEGKTVIERIAKDKESATKKHLFINFLTKTPHPLGLHLPCCFILDHNITEDVPAFKSLKTSAQEIVPGEPVVPHLAAELAAASAPVPFVPMSKKEDIKIIPVNYDTALDAISTTYIVGAEKLPLELTKQGPQIGIVPKNIDVFFAQDSLPSRDHPGLVIQDHTIWKIMRDNKTDLPSASGFFRLAAENNKRNQPDSFLAAMAPYFGKNSAAALKTQILSIVQPNLFLALNYGNFLFDYYSPSTPAPPDRILRDFAQKRFLIGNPLGITKEAVIRAWKGYSGFEAFIKDTNSLKEFRQFAQLFSLPNTMYWSSQGEQRMNGILFIVLEVDKDGGVEIRCPPYGVTAAHTDPETGCDIAFVLHYYSGVWEPLFYTNNKPDKRVFENTLVFTRNTRSDWPEIVKKRVEEYERMCHSSGLGIYTDSPFVNSKALLPLSKLMNLVDDQSQVVHAIMRDTYNHVSAVIFKTVTEELIIVPTVDDGSVYMTTPIEIEWRNFAQRLAKAEVVQDFYEKVLAPVLDDSNRETYKIVNTLRLDKTDPKRDFVYAFQLQGGLYVPVKKGSEEGQLESTIEGTELPWSIDRKIVFGSIVPDAELTVDYKEFEEIYQHLRFTFANWFSMAPGELRKQIEGILFSNGKPSLLPLYEKRQRLLIILENEILSWLDSTTPIRQRNPSLKRIDCRVSAESECKDRCVWKGDESRCLLHVPSADGSKVTKLLIRKLIEELIRFPVKRHELLNQDVGQYVKISAPFRSGNQYIVSEDMPAWSEMLRMDWAKKEESRYLEEYLAIQPLSASASEAEPAPEAEAEPEAMPPLVPSTPPVDSSAPLAQAPDNSLEGLDAEDADAEEAQEAAEPIPSADISNIQAKFGSKYFFIEEFSITDALNNFISTDEGDLEAGVDLEFAKNIVSSSGLSFYQLIYAPGNPVPPKPLVVKSTTPKADVIIIVQLPDGRIGVLSSSQEIAPITFDTLPLTVKAEIYKSPSA